MSGHGTGRWLLVAAGVVVVAAIAAGVAVMGLPSAQRDAGMDQRRVRDLDRIVDAVDQYTDRHQVLPPDLHTLSRQPGRRLAVVDPADGSPYPYEVTAARAYRLCAVFATDTAASGADEGPSMQDEWLHGIGRQCFERKPGDKARRR